LAMESVVVQSDVTAVGLVRILPPPSQHETHSLCSVSMCLILLVCFFHSLSLCPGHCNSSYPVCNVIIFP
jgi:hypothetical protein